jgi:hypothetical protein
VDLVAKAIKGAISRNTVITDTIQPVSVPTASDISPAAETVVSTDDVVSDSVLEPVVPVKEQVQTMVFVNTAKGASALAAALRKVGVSERIPSAGSVRADMYGPRIKGPRPPTRASRNPSGIRYECSAVPPSGGEGIKGRGAR